jgi:hypothetical protein
LLPLLLTRLPQDVVSCVDRFHNTHLARAALIEALHCRIDDSPQPLVLGVTVSNLLPKFSLDHINVVPHECFNFFHGV